MSGKGLAVVDRDMADATLVYDDDCGFCTWWADALAERADLELVGFSELEPSLRDRLPENYERCSHLLADGTRYSCGASIEEAFARSDLGEPARPAIERLRSLGPYNDLREWGYRRVSGNRSFWGRLVSKTPPVRREAECDTRATRLE